MILLKAFGKVEMLIFCFDIKILLLKVNTPPMRRTEMATELSPRVRPTPAGLMILTLFSVPRKRRRRKC